MVAGERRVNKKAAVGRLERASCNISGDSGKDGPLGTLVAIAYARDHVLAIAIFGNQQVTNSGKKFAEVEPSLRLLQFEDIMIIDWVVDT